MLISTNIVHGQEVDSLSYYRTLVFQPDTSEDLTNSYVFFKQRNERSLKNKDTLNVIYNLRYQAMIQFDLGLLHDSESTAASALEFNDNFSIENAVTLENRVGLNNHLGRVYNELKDYPSALKYYKVALQLQQNPKHHNTILNNIGLISYEQTNYQKALETFIQVHRTNLITSDKKKIARSLNNIGMTLSKLDNSSGLDSLKKALLLRRKVGYNNGICDSYLKISEYYQDREDYKNANNYAVKANELAKSIGNIPYERESLSLLMQLNTNVNVQRYTKLMDSLNDVNLNLQNSYAAKKYGFEKQERLAKDNELKLKTIELDNEQQKRLKSSYLFVGILILVSAVFVVIYMRSKHKKEKLQEVYHTETRISKKVHDEVANDVYQVMIKMQDNANKNEDVLDDLESIYTKTRDISKETSAIYTTQDFQSVIADLLLSYKSNTVQVITKDIGTIDWEALSEIKKIAIYRVLQELMTNMKKHSQASIVVLLFNNVNKKISINYKDNGIGSDLKKHNGLQNTENRIKSINGTITFETSNNKGFQVNILI
ncbi:tetratricopeptide repeat-containing sensor histidine kinase [Psychroserpens damuponensis]|uniref:tetratricopeptide repeat-containing sensor histidine kinase n=1 Tax=Psychroserpens damuponensis TaxID=943936 RepID=UPI00058F1A55|nr:tetratricopeptide repeat protein [Psychroserpens damuponensis]